MEIKNFHGRTVYVFPIPISYFDYYARWEKTKRLVGKQRYSDLKCADCGKQAKQRIIEITGATWLYCGSCNIG